MRGLGSIFVGLGAFAAVTAAFLLAMTLMVSGPPTWSEMRGLSDISSTAMRDLGAIRRRVAGLLEAPEADQARSVPETIAPREEKTEPPRRMAKAERAETKQAEQTPPVRSRQNVEQRRRAETARRPRREARIAPPRRADAAPLAGNPVWLMRELERGEAPAAPRIEPDAEPVPQEDPFFEDTPLPDEGEFHEDEAYEGDAQMSEEDYYEALERERAEREYRRRYERWRWR